MLVPRARKNEENNVNEGDTCCKDQCNCASSTESVMTRNPVVTVIAAVLGFIVLMIIGGSIYNIGYTNAIIDMHDKHNNHYGYYDGGYPMPMYEDSYNGDMMLKGQSSDMHKGMHGMNSSDIYSYTEPMVEPYMGNGSYQDGDSMVFVDSIPMPENR